ncbi:iron complex outermembrane recepter protein [Billgrantia gudaonensis]|uniref:Iron complex outermembrane recepter protein n=1 Tax=Billgrantia gudaonensis TaxID=376427 RepID=A0A1G8SPG7_9GAMM|nr:iron complex outermembrane recepter protein [Halomonas gudaonensis]
MSTQKAHSRFIRTPLARAIQCSLLAGSLAVGLPATVLAQDAAGQGATTQQSYSIAAGQLDTALNRFAVMADIEIAFDATLTAGKQTAGLQGSYGVEEGLQRLLAGTGLAPVRRADGSYRLERQSTDEELPLVRVEADWLGRSAVGPDEGYQAQRSLAATKADIALSDTPRTVSVVTRERIEDQNARSLSSILSYVPGISTTDFPVGDGLAGDIFYIRGMNQRDYGYGTYRDGLRVQPNAYSTSAEPYGLERVEVFKGPTSALYGENVPGGIVNLVSKRPTAEARGEFNLSYGTHDRRQVSVDVSGPLDRNGAVEGRVVLLHRQSATQTDSVSDDRIYLAPSLTFYLSDQDTLTLLGSYQKDDTEIQLGLPAAGTLLPHPSGELDSSTNLGHPEWDQFDREVWSLGYEYEHAFNDRWNFQQNARYLRSEVARKEVWWSFLGDGFGDVVGAIGRDRDNESTTFAIDNRLVGRFGDESHRHTWLAGVSFDRTSFSQLQDIGTSAPQMINVFDPKWGSAPQTPDRASDGEDVQELTGLYTQLHSKLGKAIMQVGGAVRLGEDRIRQSLESQRQLFGDRRGFQRSDRLYVPVRFWVVSLPQLLEHLRAGAPGIRSEWQGAGSDHRASVRAGFAL